MKLAKVLQLPLLRIFGAATIVLMLAQGISARLSFPDRFVDVLAAAWSFAFFALLLIALLKLIWTPIDALPQKVRGYKLLLPVYAWLIIGIIVVTFGIIAIAILAEAIF